MTSGVPVALGLILAAAVMNGAYALPLKWMPRWKWENGWMLWTILSLWVLPPIVGVLAVPGLLDLYRNMPGDTFAAMSAFGVLWGIGVFLLGLSFPLVGVAVGFAVALGSAAAAGTLLPLLDRQSLQAMDSAGKLVLLGVVVMLLGVALCGAAGRARERRQGLGPASQKGALRGFLLAFIGGTLTAALNLALAHGDPILELARSTGASELLVANAVWVPVLFAGGIPGVIYCGSLMRRGGSFPAYFESGTRHYWLFGLLMSFLWLGSVLLYGTATVLIGELGPVIGWPVFMSGAVLSSSAWGALTGEWKDSGRGPRVMMLGGILVLLVAVTIFALADSSGANSGSQASIQGSAAESKTLLARSEGYPATSLDGVPA